MQHSTRSNSEDSSSLPPELEVARPWIRLVARCGFAAIGFIHVVVGALAVQLAAGLGGGAESLRTALEAIYRNPFGGTMLMVLALGFLCYAAWMFVQAVWDPDGIGQRPVGLFFRVGFAFTGMIFIGLAVSAVRVVFAGGSGGKENENQQVQSATATVLAQPFGQVMVMLVVVVVGAMAIGSFVHAWRARFRNQLAQHRMSSGARSAVVVLGRLAFFARGLVFSAATWLFARAALQADPREAGGMAQAMGELLNQPHGRWLLGLAGAGFIAYGLFSFSLIHYRRLPRKASAES